MDRLKRILGTGWKIESAGGLTGDAYIAENDGKRLFLKRNTSPFLAVLSAEGIVPKLVWTKRMENGDVITAQEWLEGRELHSDEMRLSTVSELLKRIHGSQELLHMLMRLGKKPIDPDERHESLKKRLFTEMNAIEQPEISEALIYLNTFLPAVREQQTVVCHGDLNHHNLILTEDNQVYLIDWDNAMIADPAADLGVMLRTYIPLSEWQTWLERYGIAEKEQLLPRMFWYLLLDGLHYILWHKRRNEEKQLRKRMLDLKLLNNQIRRVIAVGMD